MINSFLRRVYRYYFLPTDPEGREEPLLNCPNCKNDLTVSGSIQALVNTGLQEPLLVRTRLDSGTLQDTQALVFMNYGVMETTCTECGAKLSELDNVYEEELTI